MQQVALLRRAGQRARTVCLSGLLVAACGGGSDGTSNGTRAIERIDSWRTTLADGRVQEVDSTYDAVGRLTGARLLIDGQLVQTRAFSFDEGGRLTRRDIDDDGDGVPERRRVYRSADNDTIALALDDDNVDGLVERYVVYLRDEAGEVIGEETRVLDPPRAPDQVVAGDGTLASATSYTVADGRLSTLSFDRNGDGTPEAFSQQNYDAQGRLTTAVSTQADGTSELTEYRYETGPCDDTWHHVRFRFYCVF